MSDLQKKNIKFLLVGYFILVAAGASVNFYLPYFLKEKGLSILGIGVLITGGLALGGLLTSLIFSKILARIKLKSALGITSIIASLANLILATFPTSIGVIITNITISMRNAMQRISADVTIQHNTSSKTHTHASSWFLATDSLGLGFGLILGIILIRYVGWNTSYILFSILALASIIFFYKISDQTRFKKPVSAKLPKLSSYLKVLLFTEILYWFAMSASFSLILTFLVTERYGRSIEWIAILFIALYASIVVTTLLCKKWIQKTNLLKTSILGMFIIGIGAVLVILSTNIFVVAVAMILEGIGAGIWFPSKTALYWDLTKPGNRESVSGYLNGFRIFFATLGPLFGAVLVTYLGILAPFYFKILVALLCIGCYAYLLKESKKSN